VKKSSLIAITTLGGMILTGCASTPTMNASSQLASNVAAIPATANQELAQDAVQNTSQKALKAQPDTSKREAKLSLRESQLIKKAAITMVVESVDKSLNAVTQIINQQQGDLIKLSENQPKDEFARHTAAIQLRVPQNALNSTLDELAKLGSVKSRNITAEEVGSRIVDFQAQLSNLRRTETNLQKIMDKAGSVRDTLSVSQELSNVRDSIERIDAQLKSLQNQVSYSTISLNLEAASSSKNPQRGFGLQVQETWNKSTNSVGKFSIGLLKLGIWLIAYSPYILILTTAAYAFTRLQRNLKNPAVTPQSTVDKK
jgi:outer membrane murein-binding lipoprotein Lpp/archaellum component FlaC